MYYNKNRDYKIMAPKTNDFDSSDSSIPKATDQPIQISEPSVTEPEMPQLEPINEDTGALIQNMDDLILSQSQNEDQMAKDINNRIDRKNKIRKILAIVAIFLIVIAIAGAIIAVVLIKESEKAAKFKDDAKIFAVKIRELKDTKSIYYLKTYGPKVEVYKSPYNRNYTNSSYVTNYYNHPYVCLSDGQRRAVGYIDEEIVLENGAKCEYEFVNHADLDDPYDYDEKHAYLTQYAQAEYKYIEPKVEVQNGKYVVVGKFFNFGIDVKIENEEPKIESKISEAEDKFLQTGDLKDICEYYIRHYYNSAKIQDKPVYEVFIAKSDLYYVRMLSNLDYDNGEKFMQEFKSYVEKHKVPMIGKVADLAAFYTEESTDKLKPLYYIAVGQKAATGEYLIVPQVFN